MKPDMLRVLAFFYLTITSAHATFLPLIIGGIVAGKVIVKGAFLALAGATIAVQIHKHLDEFWKQQLGADTQMPKSIQDCMKGNVGHQVGIDGKSLIRFESFVNPKGTADINIIINSNGNANANANSNININGNANANANSNININGNANGQVTGKSNIGPLPNPSSTSSTNNSQTTNQQISGQTSQQQQQQQQQQRQQSGSTDQQSSTKGLGPPRSSATDMAKSYGAPIDSTNTNTDTNANNANNTNTQTTTTNTATTTTVQKSVNTVEKSVQSMFFTDKELSVGKKMNIHFEVSSNVASFLPREVVDKLQFNTANLNNILDAFNLTATSQEALIMKQVLTYCEDDKPGDKCCNSLETMVEFATSITGKSTKALSTMVDKDRNLEYNVQGFRNLQAGDKAVICHKVPFPCAFFYCQKLEKTTVFLATLAAIDGSTINAPAVCYQDTNTWDPTHFAFQQLNAKPGSCPICHFLLDDDVLWIAKV